jgi:hypothetical protein
MRGAFCFMGVWHIVEGDPTTKGGTGVPATHLPATAEGAKWNLLNSRVLGAINIYVVPALQYLVADSHTTAEAWKTLKDYFGKTRGVARFVYFKELFNYSMNEDAPLQPQVSEMLALLQRSRKLELM